MSDKKHTAVEWLVNVVQSCIAPNYIPKEIIDQAKEMEREQIEEAWNSAGGGDAYSWGKDYYNANYGGQDESNH